MSDDDSDVRFLRYVCEYIGFVSVPEKKHRHLTSCAGSGLWRVVSFHIAENYS